MTVSLDGVGTLASFSAPLGAAIDANGNFFTPDFNDNIIRMISTATGVVSTICRQ